MRSWLESSLARRKGAISSEIAPFKNDGKRCLGSHAMRLGLNVAWCLHLQVRACDGKQIACRATVGRRAGMADFHRDAAAGEATLYPPGSFIEQALLDSLNMGSRGENDAESVVA